MQQKLKNKIIGDTWWVKKAFEQRQDLCDFEFETVKALSTRLRKNKYDRDLEVNNYSETSSQDAERQRDAEIQRKYEEFKGVINPSPIEEAPAEVDNTEIDSEDEREEEEKARKKSRKNKKSHVPVAMTSTKRRASLASQSSIGSIGSLEGSPRPGLKRQRSMGSRQSSFKSQKSVGGD